MVTNPLAVMNDGERAPTQYECACGHRWMGAAPPAPAEMCPTCNPDDEHHAAREAASREDERNG